jgi:hypothetical protein
MSLNDKLYEYLLNNKGMVTPESFGATGDGDVEKDTAALQDMCDYLRDNPDIAGIATGTYNIGENSITDEGANVDWSRATLQTTASGRTNSLLTIAPHPDDLADADATLLGIVNAYAAAGAFYIGASVFPDLAPYAGKAIRLRSSQQYVDRVTNDGYRREIVLVPDFEGNLAFPNEIDIATDTVFTTGSVETVGKMKTVNLPKIEITSGSTDNGGRLIEVTRSNTTVKTPSIRNQTTATQAIGVALSANFRNILDGGDIEGMREDTTQYGVNIGGQGHIITNSYVRSARRGADGSYAFNITFENSVFVDGCGGHFIFGLNIKNCTIGYDTSNSSCILVAGGNLTVDEATTLNARKGKNAITVRNDVAYMSGAIRFNGKVIFDGTDDTGTPDYRLVLIDRPSGTHNFLRDLTVPDVDVSGAHVEVLGTGHTGTLYIYEHDGSWTADGGFGEIVSNTVRAKDMVINFENGSPLARFDGVRKTWWTGDGTTFDIDLDCDVLVYWGAQAGHADPTDARANFYITSKGAVNFRTDGEATHIARIKAASYETSDAAGATSLVGDESWTVAQNGGSPMEWASVTDDSVFVVNDLAYWGLWVLSEDNEPSNAIYTMFKTDHVGAAGLSILNSGGPFTITRRTGVLSGTTGTDGEISISATGGKIYVENRSGATQALNLTYLSGRGSDA